MVWYSKGNSSYDILLFYPSRFGVQLKEHKFGKLEFTNIYEIDSYGNRNSHIL